MGPVVLTFVPAVVPVTVTLKLQLSFAVSDPPENTRLSGAVVVYAPPQALTGPAAPTVTPAGHPVTLLSVKPTPVRDVKLFGFLSVKVSVEVPPVRIDVGENALLMVGGATTSRLSSAYLVVVSVCVEDK